MMSEALTHASMIILLDNNKSQMALNHGENNSLAFFRNHQNMNVYWRQKFK